MLVVLKKRNLDHNGRVIMSNVLKIKMQKQSMIFRKIEITNKNNLGDKKTKNRKITTTENKA